MKARSKPENFDINLMGITLLVIYSDEIGTVYGQAFRFRSYSGPFESNAVVGHSDVSH